MSKKAPVSMPSLADLVQQAFNLAKLGVFSKLIGPKNSWEILTNLGNGAPTGEVMVVCYDDQLREQTIMELHKHQVGTIDPAPLPPQQPVGKHFVLRPGS